MPIRQGEGLLFLRQSFKYSVCLRSGQEGICQVILQGLMTSRNKQTLRSQASCHGLNQLFLMFQLQTSVNLMIKIAQMLPSGRHHHQNR
jgi:hypothetical protein